jgi:hypothetical protein
MESNEVSISDPAMRDNPDATVLGLIAFHGSNGDALKWPVAKQPALGLEVVDRAVQFALGSRPCALQRSG